MRQQMALFLFEEGSSIVHQNQDYIDHVSGIIKKKYFFKKKGLTRQKNP